MLDTMRKQASPVRTNFMTRGVGGPRARSGYVRPENVEALLLNDVLDRAGRTRLDPKQMGMFGRGEVTLLVAGNQSLFLKPAVAIVGTREVTPEGRQRAKRLARELATAGVVVMSGLARGVDTAAHESAIEAGGSTIAVIGTPLSKAYPAENASLQETIYRDHLLVSPFVEGETVFRSNFPKRNRVMAALSDATVIIEASDTSGTLHQAAECQRLGRWLFIARSLVDNHAVKWPTDFLGKPRTAVLESTADVIRAIGDGEA